MLPNIFKKCTAAGTSTFIKVESRQPYKDLLMDNMYIGGSKAYKGHRALNIFKSSKAFSEKFTKKKTCYFVWSNQQKGPKED